MSADTTATDQYLAALATIDNLAPLLRDQKYPTGGNQTDAYTPPATPKSRPPCNITWLDMQTRLEHLLKTAVRQTQADTQHLTPSPADTIEDHCAWLTNHAEHLRACIWLGSATWWRITTGEQNTTLAAETISISRQLSDSLNPPPGKPMTANELAARLGTTPARIRQWATRGHITPVGRRGRAKLYPLDRAKELAEKTSQV